MAINMYGMPDGYDQEANPNPRQRKRTAVPRQAPTQDQTPAPGPSPNPTAWGGQAQQDETYGFDSGGRAPQTQVNWQEQPPPVERQFEQPAPPPTAPPPPTQPVRNNTTLMEGDAGKLADPNHALKSPKYSFLQLVNSGRYGYNDGANILAELQRTHPQFWNGWTVKGDKFLYTGDPSQQHEAWKGATEVDFVGNYSSEDGSTPTGFRWGHNVVDPATQGVGQLPQMASIAAYQPGQLPQLPAPTVQGVGFTPPPVPRATPVPLPTPTQYVSPQQFSYGSVQDTDNRTYDPIAEIPEWNQPTFDPQEKAQLDALMNVLQNPGIPPQQLEQMKRIQQEQLMATRDQSVGQAKENFLRRGLRGGALGATERRANDQYGADLTRSTRDIEIANAGMRTSDVLNASQGLSSAMDGQFNRANTGYATALNRVLAGEGLRGASADSYRNVYNDDAGWGLQQANLGEQIRQYDLSQQLALRQFLEQQRQFDGNMGYNYTQLQQRQNEAVLRALGLM